MQQATTKDTNPKDLVGQTKAQMWLAPPAGKIAMVEAFMDGAKKYEPYNWREKGVRSTVYVSAIERHLMDYIDGQDLASDSQVHHLGHIMACCAILLDAISLGNIVDDRPSKGRASEILEEVHKKNEAKNMLPAGAGAVLRSYRDNKPSPSNDLGYSHLG